MEKVADDLKKTIFDMRMQGMFIIPNMLWMFAELPIRENIALQKYLKKSS